MDESDADLRAAVIGVLGDVAPELDTVHVGDDDDLQTALGLDSMDMLDLAAGLQERFATEFPDADRATLTSVGSIVDYLRRRAAP